MKFVGWRLWGKEGWVFLEVLCVCFYSGVIEGGCCCVWGVGGKVDLFRSLCVFLEVGLNRGGDLEFYSVWYREGRWFFCGI